MPTLITLDIFSGRPNPIWELTDKQLSQFKEKIYGLRERTLMKSPSIYDGLGYRGFIIESIGDEDMPEEMLINAGIVDFGWTKESYFNLDHDIELWLLETSGTILDDEVKTIVRDEIKEDSNSIEFYDDKDSFDAELLAEPPYNPGWWNNSLDRRRRNNCYNYACNLATNSFAQPGRGSGRMYGSISCSEVSAGASRDGLKSISNVASTPAQGHYAALVVGPGWDFHWYRRDNNGLWSHKPGSTPVINYDNSRQLIRDPRNANRGRYGDFCGFYHVIPGGIRIL